MTDITWTNDTRRLADLVPWENNPKRMTKKQADGLRLSIERFGFAVPFLVSPDGDIYDGHQRQTLMGAIKEYGPNAVVDVRVSSRPLSDDERRELVVRLKQNQAGWDFDMLPNLYEREELLEWGFEPEELGMYPDDEPEGDDPGPQVDRAEELREKWGVELGQLWQLGEHRLICGDCTDAAVVAMVMGGERAQMCFTSPPYNAGVSAKLRGNTSIDDNLYRDEYNDNKTQDEWLSLVSASTLTALSVCDYVFINLQLLAGNKRALVGYLSAFADKLADIAIWDKQHAAPAAALRVMDSRFEFVIVFSHTGTRAIGTREFRGMVHNVYSGSPQRNNEYASSHAATFPIDFPEHFLKTFTNNGETILDVFLGSGTTLIACERLGRRCRAIEISPAYCAVAIQRWVDMTGGVPVLLENNSNGKQ